MTESSPPPSFESANVAAVLVQRNREDHASLVDELVAMLAEVVPGVQVERALLRRHIMKVRVPLGGFIYVLTRGASGAHAPFDAARQQNVRGVVIRTDPMEIDAFLTELGLALDVELRRTERGRDALRTWLDSTSG
ncbi:MAG TPA: hypothetical protein VHV78_02885 [Gemmatimonadaceae bacterium]|jgi:hypothetical protein|nr:hypothetical protein [Gemmatimonadaceae bacterium]